MPAKDVVIGRVSVKVLPDTSDFKKRLKADLEKIERSLKPLGVGMELDTDRLSEKVRAASEEAQQAVQDVKLDINVKDDIANRIQRDVDAALKDIKFDPDMDPKRVRRKLREIEKYLLKIEDLKMEIHPEMNERQKREVERQIDDLKDKVDNIKSQIEPDVSQPHRFIAQENLARLTRPRTVAIIPVVSKLASRRASQVLASLAGARAVTHVLDELWSSLKNLDKNVPLISSIALAILGLGSMGLTTASNLFALSQSLAQIGPAALALPGILGGVTIGVGATIAVFKDFNKELPEVKKNLSKLQNAMSVDFWNRAKAPIKAMIDTLFPQFADGMEETSMELGTFFGNLATSFKNEFSHALDGMFNNLEASISIAAQHTNAYAGILETLGRKGSEQLPRLAGWFGKISEQFDNFLTKADKDGRLDDWINTGIFMLKELGRALSGLGSLLAGIARAANKAGGSTLSMLGDTLQQAADVVNGPVFQKALTGTFKAAHKAIALITEQAGPAFRKFMLGLANELQRVLPIVGRTLGTAFEAIFDALDQPAVWHGVTAFFKGIQKGIEALAPAMPSVGKAFGALLKVLGTLATTVGPVLGRVLQALADALVQIAPALQDAIEALGGALLDAVTALAPLIPKVADALVWLLDQIAAHPEVAAIIAVGLGAMVVAFQGIAAVLGPLMGALGPLVTALLPEMSVILTALAPFLLPIAGAFAAIAGAVVVWGGALAVGIANCKPLRDTLADLWQNVLVPIGKEIWKQAKENWPTIKQAFIDLKDAIVDFWTAIQPDLQDFVDFLARHMPEIRGLIRTTFTVITNVIQIALLVLSAFFEEAKIKFKIFAAVVNALHDVVSGILDFNNWLRSKDPLYKAGEDLIGGFIRGIRDSIPGVQFTLLGLTKKLPDWKGPATKDRVILRDAGKLVIGGFISGLESKYGDVKASLVSLTKSISIDASGANAARADAAMAGAGTQVANQRTLIYHAAPGSSIDSEEDLFAAADRARMVDW